MARSLEIEKAKAFLKTLSRDEIELAREMVSRVSDKWSLWTMSELADAEGPVRFVALLKRMEGISHKSLTNTLRSLERDGLLTRRVYAVVPPRVEYTITELGLQMLEGVRPLWLWAAHGVGKFQAARERYELQANSAEIEHS